MYNVCLSPWVIHSEQVGDMCPVSFKLYQHPQPKQRISNSENISEPNVSYCVLHVRENTENSVIVHHKQHYYA